MILEELAARLEMNIVRVWEGFVEECGYGPILSGFLEDVIILGDRLIVVFLKILLKSQTSKTI